MNRIRTDNAEPRDRKIYQSEWASILGRLDALSDEISRALGWSIRIEEPKSVVRIAHTP
jgi:hypothetical protein